MKFLNKNLDPIEIEGQYVDAILNEANKYFVHVEVSSYSTDFNDTYSDTFYNNFRIKQEDIIVENNKFYGVKVIAKGDYSETKETIVSPNSPTEIYMGTVYSNTSTTFYLYNFDRISIVSLKDRPDLIEESAKRFSSMFDIDIKEYLKSMDEMLTSSTYPLWLVALIDSSHIIGGLGVIENDFHSRKYLSPNICAVFTLSAYRGVRISQLLINKAIEMMHQVNIDTLYVITNHVGLYEKYGFIYLCDTECGDETSRLLIHKYKKQ